MRKLFGILMAVLLILTDQFTKYLAKINLQFDEPIVIIKNVFELLYVENRGAAFGLFQGKLFFFVIITSIVLAFIVYFYMKTPKQTRYIPLMLSLILIFSGAVGNFIDRIRLNYVVDFFYFKLIDFPVFNVADCYVSIGTILIGFLILFYYKEEELTMIHFGRKTADDHSHK